ncbi:nitrate/nitrite transporter NrtS [Ferrovibrio xuzhouensis]|uniref:Nitrate/nitrite transporter NrtS n=1 Tax=Ferrovibrio xuzhouensis TaxID=1576914 RepID=A0ABV7VK00_9PROT
MIERFISHSLESGVPRRSLLVAVFVGTVLNLINQGDAALSGGAINWTKIALTFAVPYCVATYGAVSYRLRQERDALSSQAASHQHAPPSGNSAETELHALRSPERGSRYIGVRIEP